MTSWLARITVASLLALQFALTLNMLRAQPSLTALVGYSVDVLMPDGSHAELLVKHVEELANGDYRATVRPVLP